jgi:hypothetical protein
MKIENPAIAAALENAAYALNLSMTEVVEILFSEFVERMQKAPSEFICEFSTWFVHPDTSPGRDRSRADSRARRIGRVGRKNAPDREL